MDIMLERILSLLDKNQNGQIARGEKSKFASSLGLPHNVVAEWINGKNKSYKNHLYQIADKYNVSVEWLKGETDIKEKPTLNGDELDLSGISAAKRDFISAVMDLDDDQVQALSALVAKLKAGR